MCPRSLLFRLQRVAVTLLDVRQVRAGVGILVIHIEGPVLPILIIVHGNSIHRLDVETIGTVPPFDQTYTHQRGGISIIAQSSAASHLFLFYIYIEVSFLFNSIESLDSLLS